VEVSPSIRAFDDMLTRRKKAVGKTRKSVHANTLKRHVPRYEALRKPVDVHEIVLVFEGGHSDVTPENFLFSKDAKTFEAETRNQIMGIDVVPYLGMREEGRTLVVARKVGDGPWLTNEVQPVAGRGRTDYMNFLGIDDAFIEREWK
ncbi:hypothetical protein KKA95_02850, partial [Patescibacteria group bacterium]|nr:hypothetical protein [Patescibacteria group bacterium]